VYDTLDELKDWNFYTHLDLPFGYKTAFETRNGLMKWVAMPFRLFNVLATFQRMMNGILRDFFHRFVTVYLDDVFVYIRTLEEHMEHLRLVLQRLKEEGLTLRMKKCFFGLQDIEYLGYSVSTC
jgi:hypothetical protein